MLTLRDARSSSQKASEMNGTSAGRFWLCLSRIQAGVEVLMRDADYELREGLIKGRPFLAVLENLPHGDFDRSDGVYGVGEGPAGFRLLAP